MRRNISLVGRASVVAISLACVALMATPAAAFPGDAPYSVPLAKLDAARECRGGLGRLNGDGRNQPVLLVHGTGLTREQTWQWNYWPALHKAGFEECWVRLPKRALGDAQISAEYVARAVEVMARRSGEHIDVIGHSQGGLVPRWAIKYFPSGPRVGDYVGLASPNHGTLTADAFTALGWCFPSCWQMRTSAKFIAALNDGDETPGEISYTSIYTAFDELVKPIETSALDGGSNVLIQDLCPGRPVDHLSIVVDAVAWNVAIDALTHPGAADTGRIPANVCTQTTLPGANLDFPHEPPDFSGAEYTDHEPPLKPYAR
jgi:triacylglycerol lipase